jgi:hypothetical protein
MVKRENKTLSNTFILIIFIKNILIFHKRQHDSHIYGTFGSKDYFNNMI